MISITAKKLQEVKSGLNFLYSDKTEDKHCPTEIMQLLTEGI